MLVTFHCEQYRDVVYFGDIALKLLHCMGHSGAIPGAILADEVPHALALLQQSVRLTNEMEPEIRFFNRAQPLIELLQRAIEQKCTVMWKSGDRFA